MAVSATVVVLGLVLVAALYLIVEAAIRVCTADYRPATVVLIDDQMRSYDMYSFACRMDRLQHICTLLQQWSTAHAYNCSLEQTPADLFENTLPCVVPPASAAAFEALASRLVPHGADFDTATCSHNLREDEVKALIIGVGIAIVDDNRALHIFALADDPVWSPQGDTPDGSSGSDSEPDADTPARPGLRRRHAADDE